MVELNLEPIAEAGIRVSVDSSVRVASLRYFESTGEFGTRVADAALALPTALTATCSKLRGGILFLAWRRPTEALMLCASHVAFEEIQSRCSPSIDGCFIDQTAGIAVLRAGGDRFADVFLRLGTCVAPPEPGESKCCLLADVAAMAVCVDPGETYLFVDRIYLEHLLSWIRATAADLATQG